MHSWVNWTNVFFFLFFGHATQHVECGILVPLPGIEPTPPALEAWNLNHWINRDIPDKHVLNKRQHISTGDVMETCGGSIFGCHYDFWGHCWHWAGGVKDTRHHEICRKPWTTKACPSNSLDLLVSQWTFVLVKKKKKNLYKSELKTHFILYINTQHLSQSFNMH